MKRSVSLDELPAGLRFPTELEGRIAYNAVKRQLEFEGPMSKSDFDRLLRLDNSIAYQRALEELFQTCSFTDRNTDGVAARVSLVAAGLAVAAAAVAVLAFRVAN